MSLALQQALLFQNPTLMDAPGSHPSSLGIPNCMKCNNSNFFPPIPIKRNARSEPKPDENWYEFLVFYPSGPSCGITQNTFLEIPATFTSCLRILSPVAVFPFIISHQQVRAFLFPYFCHVRTPPGQLQLVGRLLIHVFRDFPSGKVLYSQWYLRGFQTN